VLAGFYSQDPEDCKKEIGWSLITDCEFVKMDEGGWVGGDGEMDYDVMIWLGRVMWDR